MSETAIRAGIKTLLDSITGVGKVHDYFRFNINALKFLELFQDTASGKIFGWEISRTKAEVKKVTFTNFKVTHYFSINGFYGLEDAVGSEKLFNAVIELIISKLINNPIADTQGTSIPQVARIEARMFGDVLCHCATINFNVSEILVPDDEEGIVDLIKVNLKYYLQEPDTAGDVETGTTDGAATNKLIDSSQNFLTYVTVGMHVENITDSTFATVTVVDSNIQLTLNNDIFTSGENYRIVDKFAEDTIDDLDV